MSKMNKRTLEFKKRFCARCQLADQRELRLGRPHYCGYIVEKKKEPEIRNGHCTQFKPVKPKRRNKTESTTVT